MHTDGHGRHYYSIQRNSNPFEKPWLHPCIDPLIIGLELKTPINAPNYSVSQSGDAKRQPQ